MSWTAQKFKDTHWQEASLSEAARAAKTANAILRASGDEGKAISTAIKVTKRRNAQKKKGAKK